MSGSVVLDQQACLFKLHPTSVHFYYTCIRPAAIFITGSANMITIKHVRLYGAGPARMPDAYKSDQTSRRCCCLGDTVKTGLLDQRKMVTIIFRMQISSSGRGLTRFVVLIHCTDSCFLPIFVSLGNFIHQSIYNFLALFSTYWFKMVCTLTKLLSQNFQWYCLFSVPWHLFSYSKRVFSGHSKRKQKLVFKTDYRLMQVKSIAFCNTFDLH